MLTLEQARNNINEVLRTVRNPALTRDEHNLLAMSLELLYNGAKENEEDESQQAPSTEWDKLMALVQDGSMVPTDNPTHPSISDIKAYLVEQWQK